MSIDANVRIMLVDDHDMIRSGLRVLLEGEPGVSVVGEASNGREAVDLIKQLAPDIVVMDLGMPDLNGIDATRQAVANQPRLKVIGLSANTDDRFAIEMLRVGAVGFVAKVAAFEELRTAIRAVMNNKVYFSPSVIAQVAARAGDGNSNPRSAFVALSAREREVLQLIAEGRPTKQVASQLGVSVKTAETHRRNVMLKLNIESVAELTKYAIREGLTRA
jgi:DNA-binding NarL/FixJ family response regulator